MKRLEELDIPLEALSPSLAGIAETCGMDVAIALVDIFPGCEFYIPMNITASHELTEIGEEYFERLCRFYMSDKITIPVRLLSDYGLRLMIRKLDAENWPQRQIARTLGCSQRLVRAEIWRRIPLTLKLTHRSKHDPRQIDIEDYLKSIG